VKKVSLLQRSELAEQQRKTYCRATRMIIALLLIHGFPTTWYIFLLVSRKYLDIFKENTIELSLVS
jgi:hypothetical protein